MFTNPEFPNLKFECFPKFKSSVHRISNIFKICDSQISKKNISGECFGILLSFLKYFCNKPGAQGPNFGPDLGIPKNVETNIGHPRALISRSKPMKTRKINSPKMQNQTNQQTLIFGTHHVQRVVLPSDR